MNQRFGFYGFFGAITLVLLLTKLTGCASPAQAEQPIFLGKMVMLAESDAPTVHTVDQDPFFSADLGAISLLELPPGEYVADTSNTYVTEDGITVTIEDAHITVY